MQTGQTEPGKTGRVSSAAGQSGMALQQRLSRDAVAQNETKSFTESERLTLQQRQMASKNLKKYRGGDAIIIGSTALAVILVAVLIIVLVR
jgi:hypothetical protein